MKCEPTIPVKRLSMERQSVRARFLAGAAFLAVLIVFSSPNLSAQQQQKMPHIGFLYPAGLRQGTACEIVVGGQNLSDPKGVCVSGTDVIATIVKYNRPLPNKRFNEFRDYIEQARKKLVDAKAEQPVLKKFGNPEAITTLLKETGATDDEIALFFEMRKQKNDPKRQQNVQLEENVVLKIQAAPGAPAGPRELRILTPLGLSNPLNLCIGTLPEQNDTGQAGVSVETATQLTLPVVLNGRILPGAVEHFSFKAKKGAHVVISAQGRDLMPYLADAVPGWFQPVVALYDAKGIEVAYADHFRFSPDPVLCLDVPRDGAYLLEIRDALYRGREDFIYRLTVGEIPFVTSIFPLGGKVGVPTKIDLTGWNLPAASVVVNPMRFEGIHPIPELNNGFAISERLFSADTLPQCTAFKSNNDPNYVQDITLPVVIDGRINRPGIVDTFAFQCHAGEKIVAETCARRLHSELDSWLKITDAAGHQLAFNDDTEDKGAGLLPHGADSYLIFTAPADGTYRVQVGDAQDKGGPEYAYRLRISPPMQDYALRIVPSSVNGRAGMSVPVTVYALRKDGFSGGINFALKEPAKGFVLNGGRIPAGADKVRVTLTFPKSPPDAVTSLIIEGHAAIDGRDVMHPVLSADDMIQAFAYHHLVTADSLLAVVIGNGGGRSPVKLTPAEPVRIPAGGTGQVKLSLDGRTPFTVAETQLVLNDPPEGIAVDGIAPAPDGATVTFKVDASKMKAGTGGNLILEAFTERMQPAKDGKPAEKKRWSNGYLPAIPFEITGQ